MSRRFRLREIPSDQEEGADDAYKIDRRDFMRHSFNASGTDHRLTGERRLRFTLDGDV